jgi:hypothetical protein
MVDPPRILRRGGLAARAGDSARIATFPSVMFVTTILSCGGVDLRLFLRAATVLRDRRR